MLKIFAKKDTDEKAVILCHKDEGHKQVELLNSIHGGSWVQVDEFKAGDEILMFRDGMIYKGYNANQERYTASVHSFEEKKISDKKGKPDPIVALLIKVALSEVKDLPANHPKTIEVKTNLIESSLTPVAPKEYLEMILTQIKEKGLPNGVIFGDNVPSFIREYFTAIIPEKHIPVKVPGIGFAWGDDDIKKYTS